MVALVDGAYSKKDISPLLFPFIPHSERLFIMKSISKFLLYHVLFFKYGWCFPLSKKILSGIWKIQVQKPSSSSSPPTFLTTHDEVLLRLLEDGSFQQCNEQVPSEKRSIQWSGTWDFLEDLTGLCLVLDRHCTISLGCDVVLSGKITNLGPDKSIEGGDNCDIIKVEAGRIETGRCMYPRNHPCFFEQTLVAPSVLAPFEAQQVVRFARLAPPSEPPPKKRQYSPADFFDKNFFMTVSPVTAKIQSNQSRDLPVDIRTMRVSFHSNHTFQMWGMNKILRGKYEINDEDALVMDVSRFGAGQNAPGSVWSQGRGLSHDDERSYIGSIGWKDNTTILVQGSVTFGTDLGSDARPEPVGTFLLRQVDGTSFSINEDGEDDEDDRDEDQDGIFQ